MHNSVVDSYGSVSVLRKLSTYKLIFNKSLLIEVVKVSQYISISIHWNCNYNTYDSMYEVFC